MSSPFSRRNFLSMPLGVTAGLLLPRLLHAQHDHGPGPGKGSVVSSNASYAPPPDVAYTGSTELAALDALPTGRPMPVLARVSGADRSSGRVRARLVAAAKTVSLIENHPTTVWCYNGQMPGPLIEAFEGDTVEIEVENRLNQPTTAHWHGLPVPVEQDGTPMHPIAPGETRLYRYVLPEGCAGSYWYHPHPHYLTAEQVYRGLAGALIVRAHDDPLRHFPERHLFISDLRLADDGNIMPNRRNDWWHGREGQFVLVNGLHQPHIHADGSERWRIWNACNARYLRLSFAGMPFTLVGTDGGLLGEPVRGMTEILLAPAQRIEIIVDPPQAGQGAVLVAEPYDRGTMGQNIPAARRLATIEFSERGKRLAVPEKLRPIDALGEPSERHVVVLSEAWSQDPAERHGPDDGPWVRLKGLHLMLNGQRYDMGRVDLRAKLGQVEQWDLVNNTNMEMDHPFHIHGAQFQVVERARQRTVTPEPFLAWRDTVNLRVGERVRIRMRQDLPGVRMFHCHILEHEDMGMMGNLLVE